MNFNAKMLQLRGEKKMSQEELSEASGISVRTIQRIEKDEVTPRPYTVRKLLEALNVSLEALNAEAPDSSNSEVVESTKLNRFILSNFLVFLLPVIYLIILVAIWKKRKWSDRSDFLCKKVLSFQLIWIIVSTILILLTHFLIRLFGGQYTVGRLFPTPILVYLGLSLIDVFIVFKIVKSLKQPSSKWTSIIPNLF
jgi:transcriptional regulator with XRE-family HTH domain